MSAFFRYISLSDFQNPTYCLKATPSTAHKYYCPIFEKIIFSTLKRLFLTQPVSKVGIKLQEITLCPFQYGRTKPTFVLLPRSTWRYNNKGKWFLVVNKLYYTLLVDYTPLATVSTHFKYVLFNTI